MNDISPEEIIALVKGLGNEAKRGYEYLDGLAGREQIEGYKNCVDVKVAAIIKYIETHR
jgi:hypothetical protein